MNAKKREPLWLLALVPAVLGSAFLVFIMPFEKVGRPLAVASGRLACGEVLLTQTFTGTSDPYFVFFYFRPNGSQDWVEFFVDDESPYWRGSVRVLQSGDSCAVTFYGTEELFYRCGDSSLRRRHKGVARPRAIVTDPLARDYRQPVDPKTIRTQLQAYWPGP